MLQGDYDPSKTKVLHFSHNPFTHARQLRSTEVEKLREECEKLRKRVKMLEDGDKSKITRVEQIVIDEASPHEVKGKPKICHSNILTKLGRFTRHKAAICEKLTSKRFPMYKH